MKNSVFIYFVILLMIFIFCGEQGSTPELKGAYLGQTPPGDTPVIFAPGIVSTQFSEFCSVFSNDGKEFYFTLSGAPFTVLVVMRQINEVWTKPQITSYSGQYAEYDMNFTPDGSKMFYCSRRPVSGSGMQKSDVDIWYVKKSPDGWSEPEHLGFTVNSEQNEYYPVFTSDNTLYFSSSRSGGLGGADIYRSRYVNGRYLKPENLGKPVNSPTYEGDTYIAPDESYIIITNYGKPDSYGSGDLYISFKNSNGEWTEPKNMGDRINSPYNEHCPIVSPDGKYFFFSSARSVFESYAEKPVTYEEMIDKLNKPGNGRSEDVYWVDARIIEDLKPDEFK